MIICRKLLKAELFQLISKVSSEFRNSSSKILGPPTVYPEYGQGIPGKDRISSWETRYGSGEDQWIELEFEKAAAPSKIEIYETFTSGCLDKILAKNEDGSWACIWKRKSLIQIIEKSRIFSPELDLENLSTPSKTLRLEFKCSGHVLCIDSVKMTGFIP